MSVVRPVDWAPLAGSDPIGGDVAAISREARRYQDMAVELRDQVARLKRIAAQDEMLGRTADKLREAAGDLSGKMADTVGRFERVGSALQEWAPHLQHAQDVTVVALRRAQEAQYQQAAYAPPVMVGPPNPAPPTDEQVAAERRRVGLHEEASADLRTARARFDDAVDEHHRQARMIAARLDDAANDQLTDSRWEQFKGWVHEHAELIKKITEILSWVATALTFVALFIPGLNIIVLIAEALTYSMLAAHALLAFTGNGSWTDLALDVVGVLTLNLGKFAAKGIKTAHQAVRATASRVARRSAEGATRNFNQTLSKLLRQRVGAKGARLMKVNEEIRAHLSSRPLRPAEAAEEVLAGPLPLRRDAIQVIQAGGDAESARLIADMERLVATHPSPQVAAAAGKAVTHIRLARVSFGTGIGLDAIDKTFGSSAYIANKPTLDLYNHLKSGPVWSLGGNW